jgi:Carboxypeptidase regulatory-like domain
MKTIIYSLNILIISFIGCKAKVNETNTKATDSKIELECKDSAVPSTDFSGIVTDINTKEAIPNAIVELVNLNTSYEFEYRTDNNGKFMIKNIPLGGYQINVKFSDYIPATINLDFTRHVKCIADIKLYYFPIRTEKPVIYIYPNQKQKVNVKLKYAGSLTHTYPAYSENGWNVTAEPNGTLWDENNKEYYALFWEGSPSKFIEPEDGFIILGKETAAFLEDKLAYLGLNRREANEFIMYWLPRMENNAYNFIHFAGEQYEEQAGLEINPKPETIIRVMMLTHPLASKINYPLQDLTKLKKTRKGFTVVEWGGTLMNTMSNKDL